jgi:hypothetical protein
MLGLAPSKGGKKVKRSIVVMVLFLVCLTTIAFTQTTAYEEVNLAGQVMLRIREAGGGDFTPVVRRITIEQRLVEILSYQKINREYFRTYSLNGCLVIAIGKYSVVSITDADARANDTTKAGLAKVWINNLYWVLKRSSTKETDSCEQFIIIQPPK